MTRTAVGVDGCPGGWVAVVLRDGRAAGASTGRTIAAVLAAVPEADAVGVDIPIGLPELGEARPADESARAFLPGRAGTVFPTFPRRVLEAPDAAAANALLRAAGCGGISRQAYALGTRIAEVEDHLAAHPADARRVREVHPEVSFRALAGRPLRPRTTWTGLHERLRALCAAGIELPADLELAVPPADVVDAAAAAWSADRIARGEAASLPPDPPLGRGGRPVAIWY